MAAATKNGIEAFRGLGDSPWYLLADRGCSPQSRVALNRFPFRIGRHSSNDLQLDLPDISRFHAEILDHDGRLWLRECGSTNGTFVNQQRVLQASRLDHGDAVRFASLSFHLYSRMARTEADDDLTTVIATPSVEETSLDRQQRFREMLRRRSVIPFFQPMLCLHSDRLLGYEILGRCNFDGLPRLPLQALNLADSADQQIELSELFREVGLRRANRYGNRDTLFLNAAPLEIRPARLAVSLARLRDYAPDLPLVLEINENAITGRRMMHDLRTLLDELSVDLAYDDFGVGRARFLEIIEHPPDWLKFDLTLVQSLREQAGRAAQVLRSLIEMAHGLGIRTVAEGIESESDLQACRELGFDVGQGYHIGRPMPFLARP